MPIQSIYGLQAERTAALNVLDFPTLDKIAPKLQSLYEGCAKNIVFLDYISTKDKELLREVHIYTKHFTKDHSLERDRGVEF